MICRRISSRITPLLHTPQHRNSILHTPPLRYSLSARYHSTYDTLSSHQHAYLTRIKTDYEAAKKVTELKQSAVSEKYLSRFGPLYEAFKEYQTALDSIEECLTLVNEEGMRDVVQEEVGELVELVQASKAAIEGQIGLALAPPGDSIFLEITMAVGGTESAVFAQEMLQLYQSVAGYHGYQWKLLENDTRGDVGLAKAVVQITGENAMGTFHFEGGVHRVQRVPFNDTRIHTSTIVVTVIEKPPDMALKINPEDVEISFTTGTGPGGQFVNRRRSRCQLHHIPSGIRISCEEERDAAANKTRAMEILSDMLLRKMISDKEGRMRDSRKSQSLQGDRADKIRTYNYKSNRVVDHRYGEGVTGVVEYLRSPEEFTKFRERVGSKWQLEKLAAMAEDIATGSGKQKQK
eukprot:sb/3465271/